MNALVPLAVGNSTFVSQHLRNSPCQDLQTLLIQKVFQALSANAPDPDAPIIGFNFAQLANNAVGTAYDFYREGCTEKAKSSSRNNPLPWCKSKKALCEDPPFQNAAHLTFFVHLLRDKKFDAAAMALPGLCPNADDMETARLLLWSELEAAGLSDEADRIRKLMTSNSIEDAAQLNRLTIFINPSNQSLMQFMRAEAKRKSGDLVEAEKFFRQIPEEQLRNIGFLLIRIARGSKSKVASV